MFSFCYLWWYLRETLLGHPLWMLLFMATLCAARYRMHVEQWGNPCTGTQRACGWESWDPSGCFGYIVLSFHYLQVFLLYLEGTLLLPLLCYWYFCLLFPFAHLFCTWCWFLSAYKEDFLKSSLQILVYLFFCILFSVSQTDSAGIAALQGISWVVVVEKALNWKATPGINNDPLWSVCTN